jgi:hypothetical protein
MKYSIAPQTDERTTGQRKMLFPSIFVHIGQDKEEKADETDTVAFVHRSRSATVIAMVFPSPGGWRKTKAWGILWE